jgi:DNA-binding NarL/FixJ family response regulator
MVSYERHVEQPVAGHTPHPAVPKRPITVLVVDDMPRVRQELSQLLPLLGPITIAGEAASGPDAIARAAALCPDVVLMDLRMPRMGGVEAARLIKAGNPACRVIALTVHDSPAARREAALAGIEAFIVKGAPIEALAQAILAPAAPPAPADTGG